ncbi:methyltransferase domain-containing protein [Iamia sp. SCSIO 61187]|uniref:uracil-DNA glycosylase family protein n=1 Tax=Iamia sp. SCSIO 61187 TaxID=2722752 RepID=UPI001C63B102|nr:uracil-DNA glycosylase family protein [Iamia sp. SCSIO 61187]QYG92098.1 methyltransferase domain-containing protein [Iamia sp. SCSIO 61187]
MRPGLDAATVAAYDVGAATYAARGTIPATERAAALVARRLPDGPLLDLGCGTGNDLGVLGAGVVGLDPSAAMLGEARAAHPAVPLVRAAAGALPVRPRSLAGAWASKSLQHLPAAHLPLALADLHRGLAVGAPISLRLFAGAGVVTSDADDDLPGRQFTLWDPGALVGLVEGAGFVDVHARTDAGVGKPSDWPFLDVTATRGRTLADTVGPGMRLLVSGLNPSLHAADAGVGYVGPGNRFWPALAEAGLLPPGADRDPWRLLATGGIGMTDLVKRATPRASDLTTAEYRAGVARLDRLCTMLAPEAVLLVGLAGWRAGADRAATPGWQARHLGASPVYVMPSTSGLNAGTSRADLVAHLRAAAIGPPQAAP